MRVPPLFLWPILALLLVVGLSGCTSTATPAPTATSAPPTSASPGLRGYSVPSMVCPTTWPTATGHPRQKITGDVQRYVICPLVYTNGVQPSPGPLDVTPADVKIFNALDEALRSPDIHPTPHTVCSLVGQIPRPILVETTDGDWSVHQPTNRCGFPLAPVVSALNRAAR